MATKIEWCDLSINPIVGCSKCSPGCDNCYAEKQAYRLSKMKATAQKYAGVIDENGWTGKVSRLDLSCFDKLPKKPQRVFVGSMTDMFHPSLKDDGQGWRALLEIIWEYPQHVFMFLTKRAERMRGDIEWLIAQDGDLPVNLWLGVTVCNQQEADEKIPVLLQIPSAKRFISVEPMLEELNIKPWLVAKHGPNGWVNMDAYLNSHASNKLDWVICGGETGPKARSMHPDWVRSLRDQCVGANVPFFFKAWGEWASDDTIPEDTDMSKYEYSRRYGWLGDDGILDYGSGSPIAYECRNGVSMIGVYKVGKKLAGRLLDGREWNQFPE